MSMRSLAIIPAAINRQSATQIPTELLDASGDAWEAFADACREAALQVPGHPELRNTLQRVWACSEFAAQACILEPELLFELLASGDLLADYATGDYARRLESLLV
ncbi:MAG TPA: hypothetical protein VET88_08770, partial [Gammaproteobacteria bacterium]|nr:hypothetical protein [Gammaproteobacteria bacterium]